MDGHATEFNIVELCVPQKSSEKLYGRQGKKLQRIQQTFGVDVELTSHGASEIVRIRGPTDSVAKAEDHISELCGIATESIEKPVAFPADMREELIGRNEQLHRDLEACAGAVVRFRDEEAVIKGTKLAVEVTAMRLEQRIKFYKKLRQSGADIKDYVNHRPAVVSAMLHVDDASASERTSDDSSGESDGSSEPVVRQPDPKLIKYGVELGWREEDVTAVILQLGGAADNNGLLNHLLKRFPGSSGVSPSSSPVRTTGEVTINHITARPASGPNSKSLRPIVIDGSNVAMAHSNGKFFSCRGILKCVEYFRERGHTEITCFVPMWRKETSKPESPISDQEILLKLHEEAIVVFTPSRRVKGKRVTCYDDRYVVQLADETGGVIVSNDNYRDLAKEKKQWRTVIDERLLMYTFAQDRFMPPADPLGLKGPSLDEFLRFRETDGSCNSLASTVCPFDVTCTYGSKCKYGLHPQRDLKTSGQKPQPQTVVQRVMQRENPDLVAKGPPTVVQRAVHRENPDLVAKGPEPPRQAMSPRRWDLLTGVSDDYPTPPPPPFCTYDSQPQQMYSGMDVHYSRQPPPQEYFSRGPSSTVQYSSYTPPMPPPPQQQQTEQYPYYQSPAAAQADMQAFLERRHLRSNAAAYQHPSDMYSGGVMPPTEPPRSVYHGMPEHDPYMQQQRHPYNADPHDAYMMPPQQQWSGYGAVPSGYSHPQSHGMHSYDPFAEEAVRQFSNNFQERIIREVIRLYPEINNLETLYQQIIMFLQRQRQPPAM